MLKYTAAALLTCLLWATSARGEDISVPVTWKGQEIQIGRGSTNPAGRALSRW